MRARCACRGAGPARGQLIRVLGDERTTLPIATFDEGEGVWRHVPIEPAQPGERVFIRLDANGLRYANNIQALAGVHPLLVESYGAHEGTTILDTVMLELTPQSAGSGVIEVRLSVDGRESNPVTVEIR